MPVYNGEQPIRPILFGGKPEVIWLAHMVFVLKIRFPYNQNAVIQRQRDVAENIKSVTLNVQRDLGIDLSKNDIVAIDWGDSSELDYVISTANKNHTYSIGNSSDLRNNSSEYEVKIYVRNDKPTYYPFEKYNDNPNGYSIKTSGIRFAEKYKG